MRVKISPAKKKLTFFILCALAWSKNSGSEFVVQQEVVLHEDLPWIERVKKVNNSLNLSNSLRGKEKRGKFKRVS